MSDSGSQSYLKPETSQPVAFDHEAAASRSHLTYGRCIVFGRNDSRGYFFVIGPHWHVSTFGFLFLFIFGSVILQLVWSSLPPALRVVYLALLGLSLALYAAMFVLNPGIIPQKQGLGDGLDIEDVGQYSCTRCLALKAQRAFHCPDCDICVERFDHHCIWIGKCVGGGNLRCFYLFVAVVPSFFVFVMLMTCFLGEPPK